MRTAVVRATEMLRQLSFLTPRLQRQRTKTFVYVGLDVAYGNCLLGSGRFLMHAQHARLQVLERTCCQAQNSHPGLGQSQQHIQKFFMVTTSGLLSVSTACTGALPVGVAHTKLTTKCNSLQQQPSGCSTNCLVITSSCRQNISCISMPTVTNS